MGKAKASKRKSTRKRGGEGREIKSPEVLPPDPSFLQKFYENSEVPMTRDPSVALTVRVFERDSELKGAFKREFASQLEELYVCNFPQCQFRYVPEEGDRDPTVRMLVHHYLHLAREAEARVQIAALNRMAEILDPPKERVTSGLLKEGVLSSEEKKLLKLTKEELEDI